MKINELTSDYSEYLKIIQTIAKPPKRLWYAGELPSTRRPTVAIIGTRRPTTYGREVTTQLASELARAGIVIVSGLALGIDAIAHQAALDAGGTTIAVLPAGLDAIYPRSHHQLARDIIAHGGALLTEYNIGQQIYRQNFIARNRIVSGISDGIIVVEASVKSGTMHTAGFALEQGRAVMSVPGNITSPVSGGCNNLIKSGARPITIVQDVLDELGFEVKAAGTQLPLGDSPEEHTILRHIIRGARDAEVLCTMSGLSPALFSQTLTMLEITGKIRPLGNNKWTIT